MKKTYTRKVINTFIILTFILTAQAQNISNYSFSPTSGTYTALSGSTAPALSGGTTNDGWYNSISIGFEFWFMGVRYDNVGASTNGWLTFGLGATFISSAIPANSFSSSSVPRPFVAPLWDDLDFTQSLGVFSYKTTGTAPNRIFTAEWLNAEWGWGANDSVISFQVKLYESAGKIDFIYRQENSPVASGTASIGIQGASTFQSLNGTGTSPTSSTATSTNNLNTKPASGQVYSFIPPIPATPTGLGFTSVTQNSMTLNWTDNATNEFGYVIYTSTDSINYTFQTQLVANTTTSAMLSLLPGTRYYYKIYAVTEGGMSNVLAGSQTTLAGILSGVIAIPGAYPTITAAIAAIQTNGFANSIILELQSSYTCSGETFPITLPNNLGATPTKTITLRPASGVSSVTITTTNYNGTINFNGCKYFKIDGRPGGTGLTQALTINNDYVSPLYYGVINFTNDACNDTIRYCNITGSNVYYNNSGLIYFGSTSGTSGNDNNSIENCNIHAGNIANPPVLIYSYGTLGKENNSNTIANNNLYDFSSTNYNSSYGIFISSYSTDFRITGNHIYQTQSITSTISTSMSGIYFGYPSGMVTISNNYIGGSARYCGSSAWELGSVSMANQIIPIMVYGSSTATSIVSGNIISNFLLGTNSSGIDFIGINVSGLCNVRGNIIGAASGTGNITIVSEYVGTANVYGISASINDTVANNLIGSFNVGGSLPAHGISFTGIAGGGVITNNLIGSRTTANSIIASNNSTNGQFVYGISSNSSSTTISGNTISNLTNTSTSANANNFIIGIYKTSGGTGPINIISGNIIQNLSCASSASSNYGALTGIVTSSGVNINVVSQNIITNLYATNTTSAAVVNGIFLQNGAGSNTDTISSNFIHSFSISSPSASSIMVGISLNGNCMIKNNMIRLGIKPDGSALTNPCIIYGINKISGACTSIHNSIYVGGSGVVAGSGISACFNKNDSGLDYIYNNIFYNERTNSSTGGNHFTMNFPTNAGGCNYNLYYSGVPLACMLSANGTTYTNFTSYKSATGFDSTSGIADPRFVNSYGNSASVDLHINSVYATPIESFGSSTYTATDDFDGQIRSSLTPVDVGADAGNFTQLVLPVKWLSFEGQLENNKTVLLNWSTASEVNNEYFEVEKNVHGQQSTVNGWEVIGHVKGNGNSNTISHYQFEDNKPWTVVSGQSTIYYRLKQIDADGNFEYSNIISITLKELKDAIIISPNPFSDKFEILLPANFSSEVVTLDIRDVHGRSVFSETYLVQKDQSKISVETKQLSSGIYFVNFTTNDGMMKYQKLVKE